MAVPPLPGSAMSNETALNSEQDLASIPTAQGGLSRLAIARLKSAGVPVAPLLKRAGLTQEMIASRLGARRAGITVAAGVLQAMHAIDYRRGQLHITDRGVLESAVCECYAIMRNEFRFTAPTAHLSFRFFTINLLRQYFSNNII